MNSNRIEPQAVIKELLELYGGPEKAWRRFEEDYAQVAGAWNQDTGKIGRILRAHLFVEHFLTEYLSARNPELGSLEEARLTFSQKLALVGEGSGGVSYLLPGVRRLNVIRNRLAHSLRAEVTMEDADAFLAIDLFRAMRDAGHAPRLASADPIDVLEDFAKHAGLALHASASRDADLWSEAFRRAEAKSRAS